MYLKFTPDFKGEEKFNITKLVSQFSELPRCDGVFVLFRSSVGFCVWFYFHFIFLFLQLLKSIVLAFWIVFSFPWVVPIISLLF